MYTCYANLIELLAFIIPSHEYANIKYNYIHQITMVILSDVVVAIILLYDTV